MSSNKKTDIVLELLRGSSIEALSRQNKVAVHHLNFASFLSNEWGVYYPAKSNSGLTQQE